MGIPLTPEMLEGWKKFIFANILAVMGFILTFTRHMSGDAFAFHCVGIMGFLAGSLVASEFVKKREERLTQPAGTVEG